MKYVFSLRIFSNVFWEYLLLVCTCFFMFLTVPFTWSVYMVYIIFGTLKNFNIISDLWFHVALLTVDCTHGSISWANKELTCCSIFSATTQRQAMSSSPGNWTCGSSVQLIHMAFFSDSKLRSFSTIHSSSYHTSCQNFHLAV